MPRIDADPDAWKGEHLIRARPTPKERAFTTLSQAVQGANRRMAGAGVTKRNSAHPWSKQIHFDAVRARSEKAGK